MLNSNDIKIPLNLINIANKTKAVPAAVVCADQLASIKSAKKAHDLGLIIPILIGDKKIIIKLANDISWNMNDFEIINSSDKEDAAMIGCQLAKDKKIKILIKGNIHTDALMKIFLRKDYKLIEGKRLSHIWHMTLSENDKPLFITDGALNVSPRCS